MTTSSERESDHIYAYREARIRLTTHCNYHCFFCHEEGGCKGDEAEWKSLRKLLLSLKEQGRKEITFTGGEPLLNKPVLLRALDEIACWDVQPEVTVVTNGSFMDDEVISALHKLKKAKVHVSVHDTDAEVYQTITRQKGQKVTTPEDLRPVLKRIPSNEVLLKLNAVLTRRLLVNKGQPLDSLLTYARDVGAKCIKFIELLKTKDASSWPMEPLSTFDMNQEMVRRGFRCERETMRTFYWKTPDGLTLEVTRCHCSLGCEHCEAVRGDYFAGATLYHPCFLSSKAISLAGRPLEDVLAEGQQFLEKIKAGRKAE